MVQIGMVVHPVRDMYQVVTIVYPVLPAIIGVLKGTTVVFAQGEPRMKRLELQTHPGVQVCILYEGYSGQSLSKVQILCLQ